MTTKKSVKPKMTVDEFFEYLASMSHLTEVRKWLKSQDGKSCPITAVCKSKTNAYFGTGNFDRAAKKIGLHARAAENIAGAADGGNYGVMKRYRKRLFKAVRLPLSE